MIWVNGKEIAQEHFSAGELKIKLFPSSREVVDVVWHYENDAELFTIGSIREYYMSRPCRLYIPYLPHARMDRVKNVEDVFTLKYFCEVINSLKFDVVWVRDAHSNVSLALLDNVIDEGVVHYVREAINQSGAEALFFPDEGAMKRYADLFKDMPYAFGMKKRDWKTGQIQGLDLVNPENIVDKKVLIVDDICSRGGTFYHSAKALHKAGAAEVNLYITHCEFTIHEGDLREKDLINQIYTTDSILRQTYWFDKINFLN